MAHYAFVGKSLMIPYARIIDMEFGQKAGRRVGAAIGTSLLLGPIGLVTLFSKKKNHSDRPKSTRKSPRFRRSSTRIWNAA
jgi:hypothetical protein